GLGVATEQLAVADDALALRADVDQDLVLVDADGRALDHVAVLEALDVGVLFGEQLLHRRRLGTGRDDPGRCLSDRRGRVGLGGGRGRIVLGARRGGLAVGGGGSRLAVGCRRGGLAVGGGGSRLAVGCRRGGLAVGTRRGSLVL